jgi:hypothetical protein
MTPDRVSARIRKKTKNESPYTSKSDLMDTSCLIMLKYNIGEESWRTLSV